VGAILSLAIVRNSSLEKSTQLPNVAYWVKLEATGDIKIIAELF
jgi:hypothetical protein